MEPQSLHVLTSPLHELSNDKRYLIALSGGIDSVLLLTLAAPILLEKKIEVCAIHVHHGLSPNADSWVEFCQTLCSSLKIDLIVEYVQLVYKGEGVEAAARDARYQAFIKHMDASSCLLLAQHQNDQLETILMRMQKGTDVRLLGGIPRSRVLERGYLMRPWLDVPRALIESAASQLGLSWIEDESNQDLSFTRNKIRHELLPKLEQAYSLYSPHKDYRQDLLKLAHCSSSLVDLENRAFGAIRPLLESSGYAGLPTLNIDSLKALSSESIQQVFRSWLGENSISQPSVKILSRVKKELVEAESGSRSLLHWKGGALMRHGNRAYCFHNNPQECLAQSSSSDVNAILNMRSMPETTATSCEALSSINLPDVIPGRKLEVSVMDPRQVLDLAREYKEGQANNFVYLNFMPEKIEFRQRLPGDVIDGLSLKDYWKKLSLPSIWRVTQTLLIVDGALVWAGWDREKFRFDKERCFDAKSVIWLKSIVD